MAALMRCAAVTNSLGPMANAEPTRLSRSRSSDGAMNSKLAARIVSSVWESSLQALSVGETLSVRAKQSRRTNLFMGRASLLPLMAFHGQALNGLVGHAGDRMSSSGYDPTLVMARCNPLDVKAGALRYRDRSWIIGVSNRRNRHSGQCFSQAARARISGEGLVYRRS